jgi:carboxypeptidase T
MKKIIFCILLGAISLLSFSQAPAQYMRAKIYAGSAGIPKLAALGLDMEHIAKGKDFIISDFSLDEIALVKAAGFKVDILIPDVNKWYASQSMNQAARMIGGLCKPRYEEIKDPVNFKLGSFAGYLTLAEMESTLDSMRAKFPDLVSVKKQIDTTKTWEGRTIWYIRISNHPDSNENKPQILYTALHHAREPGSMMQLVYYIWYLLENYNSDPRIKTLVDGTEMYFVPCVNPDGYLYNQTISPGGGGMWRKNRRNNNDGTFGVDLNRNYGYGWGSDNIGSSPNKNSETYRGPSAFSEPETRALRNFCNNHRFKLCLNYHTFANVLIYPDVGVGNPVDSAAFLQIARHITLDDNYTNGTCLEVLFYTTNGDADDWMYGEKNTKPKIYSLTPEVGDVDYGFWPPQSMIHFNCRANIHQNIRMAQMLLNYGVADDASENLVQTGKFVMPVSMKRLGLDSTAPLSIKLIPLSSNLDILPKAKSYSLNYLQEKNDTFQISFTPGIQKNDEIKFILQSGNGLYTMNDTITKYYGPVDTLFKDNADNLLKWSGDWDIETDSYHSPPTSFTESAYSNYTPLSLLTHQTVQSIDLTNVTHATLSFWARWDIQNNYDEMILNIRENGSETPVCGKYTAFRPLANTEVYQGNIPEWKKEIISLDAFAGKVISLKFVFTSDQSIQRNGFNLDDILVTAISKTNAGIASQLKENEIKIFPNPAKDYIYIEQRESGFSSLKIMDIAGKEIMDMPITVRTEISTTNMEAGIYFFIFTSQAGTAVKKVEILNR